MAQWWESPPINVARIRFPPSAICGLRLLLVLALLWVFSSGSPVFFPPQKPTSPNFNSTRIEDPAENQLKLMWLPLKYYNLFFYIFLPLVYIPLSRHPWFPNFSVLVELSWNLRPLLLPSSPQHHTSLIVWCGRTSGLNCLLSLNNNSTVCYALSSRFDRCKAIWKRS